MNSAFYLILLQAEVRYIDENTLKDFENMTNHVFQPQGKRL